MFGRKRKKETDGQMCPLCQLVNAQDAETCTRCYYEFTIAAHRQTVSEITDEESGGLFDALMEEDEEDEDDSPLVDWTSHSFSMDDMTVEVSPYDDQGLVEVDQSVSMDHQFDAPQQVARVKGKQEEEEEEEEEYVLTAADAPKNVTKFDTGDGPDLAFQEEEYSAPVVKLVEMTESADIEPVQSASEIQDDDSIHGETETTPEPESETQSLSAISPPVPSIPAVPPTPAIPAIPPTPIAPAVASTPAIPASPPAPAIPSTLAAPPVPAVPAVPTVPTVPSSASVPTPTSTGIWPWPQSDAWDDATVRKMLRDAMESAKSGDIETSKRTLVTLGPHLGDRIDLVFHIGVLLKKFKQEEVMRRMIEAARVQHPTSPEVAKAVQHLLS